MLARPVHLTDMWIKGNYVWEIEFLIYEIMVLIIFLAIRCSDFFTSFSLLEANSGIKLYFGEISVRVKTRDKTEIRHLLVVILCK